MEEGMPPSRSLNYLGAFLAFFFHHELSFGEVICHWDVCGESSKIKLLFLKRPFSFHAVSRTDLTWTQENYYAKSVPRTGKVLSHPH